MLINELFYDRMWYCFLSADGNKLLYGNKKKQLIDLRTKEIIETPFAAGYIRGHFNADGSLFCSLSAGGTLNILRTDNGSLVYKRRINTRDTFYLDPVFFGEYIYLFAAHHYSRNKVACLYRIDYAAAGKPELIFTFERGQGNEFFVSDNMLFITLETYTPGNDAPESYEVYYITEASPEPVCRVRLAPPPPGNFLFRHRTEEIVVLHSHPILAEVTVVSIFDRTGEEKGNFIVPFRSNANAILVHNDDFLLLSLPIGAKIALCDLDGMDYEMTRLASGVFQKTDNDRHFVISNMNYCGLYRTED